MSEEHAEIWCTDCGGRFKPDEVKEWGCPSCKNQGVPCGSRGDVWVQINWHELHVLCCWAERWAQHSAETSAMTRTVYAIARRLRTQWPEFGPLTLSEEVAELPVALRDHGMGIQGVRVESNVARPTPVPVNGPGAVGHARMPRGDLGGEV